MFTKPFPTALEFLQDRSRRLKGEFDEGVARTTEHYTEQDLINLYGETCLNRWNEYLGEAHDYYGRLEIRAALKKIKSDDKNYKHWNRVAQTA